MKLFFKENVLKIGILTEIYKCEWKMKIQLQNVLKLMFIRKKIPKPNMINNRIEIFKKN